MAACDKRACSMPWGSARPYWPLVPSFTLLTIRPASFALLLPCLRSLQLQAVQHRAQTLTQRASLRAGAPVSVAELHVAVCRLLCALDGCAERKQARTTVSRRCRSAIKRDAGRGQSRKCTDRTHCHSGANAIAFQVGSVLLAETGQCNCSAKSHGCQSNAKHTHVYSCDHSGAA